jgi:chemotaxis protein MotB
MGRKTKHAAHENHERWLVSYADFITLLFAFFVVMFASSQADKGKAQKVSESVKAALEDGKAAAMVAAILGGTVDDKGQGNAQMKGPGGIKKTDPDAGAPTEKYLTELLPSLEFLTRQLKPEIESGKIQIRLEPRGLVVSLAETAFFPSGEDVIPPAAYGSIEKIAGVVVKLPNPVRLEGHTDSLPIHTSRFRSNWELSAARGAAVLELLSGRYGVDKSRLALAGYADNIPLESNSTEQGRARNRRVDVVMLTSASYTSEPAAAAEKKEAATAPAAKH